MNITSKESNRTVIYPKTANAGTRNKILSKQNSSAAINHHEIS